MALLLKKVYVGYYWLFNDIADPRTEELNLFLMSSPIQPVLVIGSYLYFVYNLGPKLMENRKAFDLKGVLIVYNFVQILLNAYIVYEAGREIIFNLKDNCDPVDYSSTPSTLHLLKIYHLFFLIKMADLLDTVFFVLRKKYNQISFLHVYHHFGMVIMIWIAVKFIGGGAGVYIGLINGTVHTVMYTYYLLTAIDDKWKSSITFKRTITQMQLAQFCLFLFIYGSLLLKPDCQYPKLCSYFFVPQNFFMILLFGDFYRKTYMSKKNTSQTAGSSKQKEKNA